MKRHLNLTTKLAMQQGRERARFSEFGLLGLGHSQSRLFLGREFTEVCHFRACDCLLKGLFTVTGV